MRLSSLRIFSAAVCFAVGAALSGDAPSGAGGVAPALLPLVIPAPKTMSVTGPGVALEARICLAVADPSADPDQLLAETVQDEMTQRLGLASAHVAAGTVCAPDAPCIVAGEPDRMPLVADLLARCGARAPAQPEGYCIRMMPRLVLVAGRDPAGTYYGIQTLCQLLTRQGDCASVAGVSVDDYPTLAWRGAHLFVGNNALAFHKQLIEGVFARYKLNNLVLECEQAQWETTRGSAPAWAMSKDDLQQDIAFARRHHMTVTPLIESAGHMEWLFQNPALRGLAEDPRTPYAVRDSSRADHLLFRLYDEVLDTFHSDCLHIGGDEVTLHGRYPDRSRRFSTAASEFVDHVTRIHDYLHGKGVQTMMWGDMLLSHEEGGLEGDARSLAEARRAREALPKDVLITDWHYAPSGDFASPELFQASGFPAVIGATWYEPSDIGGFSKALAAQHQQGLLQTTWAGFDSGPDDLKSDPKQFSAFVIAAECAWNGGANDPTRLPYDPAQVFQASFARCAPTSEK